LSATAAAFDECLLPPLASLPPEWHFLPAHILELIVESALLPENELLTTWKERAVSFFFFFFFFFFVDFAVS